MKTIPENPQPGDRYADYVGGGRWTVQTNTTGSYDPYICLSPLSEDDARLLVFGAKMVEALIACKNWIGCRETINGRETDCYKQAAALLARTPPTETPR